MNSLSAFLLNCESSETGTVSGSPCDGDDVIFRDVGNDWLVGGTGHDHLHAGWGDDLLDAYDREGVVIDLEDMQAEREQARNGWPSEGDFAFGGAGHGVLVTDSTDDRRIDWHVQGIAYVTPTRLHRPTVTKVLHDGMAEFLDDRSPSDGADPTRTADTEANRCATARQWRARSRQQDVPEGSVRVWLRSWHRWCRRWRVLRTCRLRSAGVKGARTQAHEASVSKTRQEDQR